MCVVYSSSVLLRSVTTFKAKVCLYLPFFPEWIKSHSFVVVWWLSSSGNHYLLILLGLENTGDLMAGRSISPKTSWQISVGIKLMLYLPLAEGSKALDFFACRSRSWFSTASHPQYFLLVLQQCIKHMIWKELVQEQNKIRNQKKFFYTRTNNMTVYSFAVYKKTKSLEQSYKVLFKWECPW